MGFLLPVPSALLMLATWDYFHLRSFESFISLLFIGSFYGFVFMGIPLVIYTFLMEFIVNKFIKSSLLVVFISCVLGGISGGIIFNLNYETGQTFFLLGILSGLMAGIILRLCYLKSKIDNQTLQGTC